MSKSKKMWNLTILVTNLDTERTLEVTGETHVGNAMVELVEKLDVTADWSDHGLWWPQKNMWLLKPRLTLDIYGVQADAKLHFTPIHKNVRIQLPDLQFREFRIDFSKRVFNTVQELCAEVGIRHPEELSLLKSVDRKKDGKKIERSKTSKSKKDSSSSSSSEELNITSPDGKGTMSKQTSTLSYNSFGSPGTPSTYNYSFQDSNLSQEMQSLIVSPSHVSDEALATLPKPKTLHEKAFLNKGWLDSSRSLMEQEVKERDTLLLRFKYFTFFDLNPKADDVRINQLYEQAKWSILTEEVECTEEEMMSFAALQFQIKLLSATPDNEHTFVTDEPDDIDAALTDLQATLEGSTAPIPQKLMTSIPEISDYLTIAKMKKFGMKSHKKYWCVFRDTSLSYSKGHEDAIGQADQKLNLRGCEVTPEVNVHKDKYNIRLKVTGMDGVTEIELGCSSEAQYSKWMAACRMASKGRTMADSSYDSEVAGIQAFLSMQHDKTDSTPLSPGQISIQPEDFVGPRMIKKYKSKQIASRILEHHSSLAKMSLAEAKMTYIRQWQALPEFGVTYFLVKFRSEGKQRKEELLGICFNRMVKMDTITREVQNTWRYNAMKAWNVNWETKEMIIQCEDETVTFFSLTSDIKVIHEFIGGYIYLSMRKDVNQPPNEELFHKLTGGWV